LRFLQVAGIVLPGVLVELPGYFRISLTANDEMIERALPGFASAIEEAEGDRRQVAGTGVSRSHPDSQRSP
jgi:hypothetical protein